MAKYLAAQLRDIDSKDPVHDYREILGIDLKALSLDDLLGMHANSRAIKLVKIRQRTFAELAKIFWSFYAQMNADFKAKAPQLELAISEDPWARLTQCIEQHLRTYVAQTKLEADTREDLKLPLYLTKFSLIHARESRNEGTDDIYKHLENELATGLLLWADFIELMHRCYEFKFGEKMPEALFKASIRSNAFINIAINLGRSSAVAEEAFFSKVSEKDKKTARIRLAPSRFDLIGRNGIFILVMREEVEEAVDEVFHEKFRHSSQKGSCPASQVQGEEGLVIKEFAAWVVELFCEYYAPLVSSGNQCPPSVG